MQMINEPLGVYRIDPSELTMKQIRENFTSWGDDVRLGEIIMFYDREEDRVMIGSGANEDQIKFCLHALSDLSSKTLESLDQFSHSLRIPGNRDISIMLMKVVSIRMEKKCKEELEAIPGSKFICVDDDIFQISKIVSVKSRDEMGRYFIEFYITNKRASVKKAFPTKSQRDLEFRKIQKILETVA